MKEYIERKYRRWMGGEGLIYFQVSEEESDLYIGAIRDLSDIASKSLHIHRNAIKSYIEKEPKFKFSLNPLPITSNMKGIVKEMAEAAVTMGVGPMASVAGAIAEWVARDLAKYSEEVIVENGGDIYLIGEKRRKVAIFAGESIISGKLAINLSPNSLPVAIATSSGTVGPSLSFGKADAVVVVSPGGALADAAATALGNIVNNPEDFEKAIAKAKNINGIKGVIIICKEKIALWGDINISFININ